MLFISSPLDFFLASASDLMYKNINEPLPPLQGLQRSGHPPPARALFFCPMPVFSVSSPKYSNVHLHTLRVTISDAKYTNLHLLRLPPLLYSQTIAKQIFSQTAKDSSDIS